MADEVCPAEEQWLIVGGSVTSRALLVSTGGHGIFPWGFNVPQILGH